MVKPIPKTLADKLRAEQISYLSEKFPGSEFDPHIQPSLKKLVEFWKEEVGNYKRHHTMVGLMAGWPAPKDPEYAMAKRDLDRVLKVADKYLV